MNQLLQLAFHFWTNTNIFSSLKLFLLFLASRILSDFLIQVPNVLRSILDNFANELRLFSDIFPFFNKLNEKI